MADKNFLTDIIDADLAEGKVKEIHTRFPPEPNGYLHIGSAKAIYINWSIANQYGGKFNLRLDDTNPAREGEEYVNSIIEDLHWLGADPNGGIFYGSDYFDKCYEYAEKLILEGKAYVDDLTRDEMREYRGADAGKPSRPSPWRDRNPEENLDLFFRRHVDRERKCVFERVLPDGGHLFDVMEGRLLNPGHALENLWFIMDVANDMGRRDMVDDVAEIMLWVVERGWDKEYGGLFYYQDYMGYPTDKLESQMKLWWVHAEAINAFLLAHKLTGRQEHLDWFKRLHNYSFEHFSDHEYGEWYGYLDREGRPVFGLKGGKWKGFFHLPRMLMVCERWLNEMAEQ